MQESLFLEWFCRYGEISQKVGLYDYKSMGRGAIAKEDIAEGDLLFSLPRELVLSIHTASLPPLLERDEWSFVNHGWTGLILCMMYENFKQEESKWHPYLELMPTQFDSLMFWSEEELLELKGSVVIEKIGKKEAEQEYYDRVQPLLKTRSDIFPDPSLYTLGLFHTMGSLILSRSFEVENVIEGDEGDDSVAGDGKSSSSSVDDTNPGEKIVEEEGEEEEGGSTADDVGMVPFADILNAKSGHNNARLFYEPSHLEMRATNPILQGEQIYNTYADPPNSDLLRRYGHIDEPNQGDCVEIRADTVEETVCKLVKGAEAIKSEKVDWLLEQGLDECVLLLLEKEEELLIRQDSTFTLSHSNLLPDELIQCILIFAASSAAFEKMRQKEELPNPQRDIQVMKLINRVLVARLALYPTTLEEDRILLEAPKNYRHRLALVVRMGEKVILEQAITASGSGKRKRDIVSEAPKKRNA